MDGQRVIHLLGSQLASPALNLAISRPGSPVHSHLCDPRGSQRVSLLRNQVVSHLRALLVSQQTSRLRNQVASRRANQRIRQDSPVASRPGSLVPSPV